MEIEYIKANGKYYRPQKAGVRMEDSLCNHPVCVIKKLFFGVWRIDYHCEYTRRYIIQCGYTPGDEDIPNKRLILYPSGIEEISYLR